MERYVPKVGRAVSEVVIKDWFAPCWSDCEHKIVVRKYDDKEYELVELWRSDDVVSEWGSKVYKRFDAFKKHWSKVLNLSSEVFDACK